MTDEIRKLRAATSSQIDWRSDDYSDVFLKGKLSGIDAAWSLAMEKIKPLVGALEKPGRWLSASLEDPWTCNEMKADVEVYLEALREFQKWGGK